MGDIIGLRALTSLQHLNLCNTQVTGDICHLLKLPSWLHMNL